MVLDIDVRALESSTDFTSAYFLGFLVNHDWEDFGPTLTEDEKKALAPDQNGTITLNAAARTFTIKLPTIHNQSAWTFQLPGTVFHNLVNAPGTLYTAPGAPLPNGRNKFWIQQFPPKIPGPGHIGRTVIEFYTNNVITAIFKTKVDNYGGAGVGVWSHNLTE